MWSNNQREGDPGPLTISWRLICSCQHCYRLQSMTSQLDTITWWPHAAGEGGRRCLRWSASSFSGWWTLASSFLHYCWRLLLLWLPQHTNLQTAETSRTKNSRIYMMWRRQGGKQSVDEQQVNYRWTSGEPLITGGSEPLSEKRHSSNVWKCEEFICGTDLLPYTVKTVDEWRKKAWRQWEG